MKASCRKAEEISKTGSLKYYNSMRVAMAEAQQLTF